MNYNVEVIGLDKLIEKLTLATAEKTLQPPLMQSGFFLKQWISENRFITGGGSGKAHPSKLTSRTGRLMGSITVSTRDKLQIAIGTNVEYARIHEFGFAGYQHVSGHIRVRRKNVKLFGKTRNVRTGPIFVTAFDRGMIMPARPFLRPSIENENNITKITASINKAIQEALSK